MLNFTKNPPPTKAFKGVIKSCDEWHDMCLALGAGLKPQEYIQIEFPKDHALWKQCKNPTQAFLLAAKLKLKELGLPYDAYVRGGIICIVGRGVMS